MVETQLNAIEFRKSRIQAAEYRQRKQKESGERRESRYEVAQREPNVVKRTKKDGTH